MSTAEAKAYSRAVEKVSSAIIRHSETVAAFRNAGTRDRFLTGMAFAFLLIDMELKRGVRTTPRARKKVGRA